MSLFLSTFHNKIDKKGRVSVPASFRAVLMKESFAGMIAFRSLALPAVEGFGMARMEKLSADTETLDVFSESYSDLTASIFADAHPLSFDSEGRVLLSPPLREHAELTDTATFIGRGTTFQIWNPNKFKTYQQEARERLRTNRPALGGGVQNPGTAGEGK
jgi:MraZ protein